MIRRSRKDTRGRMLAASMPIIDGLYQQMKQIDNKPKAPFATALKKRTER
ncbi:MAG: hypothetical protein WAM14_03830 [Candidatus Nitrosopolaris sp.]